ncbi:MAG TPA: AsmA-like C-terminal domain-containing protein, partial [Desulfuromonadales bacterium]|nr:AsmA-like C-terminal domain-containing protein [Desulfuromonadales bacterium]
RRIKADELIFHSDTKILHDLDGELGISASGIDFRHIRVRLDGGTVAVVNGTLRDFHAPRVRLDITSKQADIGEVIALWHRSEKAPPLPAEEPEEIGKKHTTLFISAHAQKGVLYGMRFENAKGDIVSNGHGILAIYPLHFRSGKGKCTAQVLVDHTQGAPPILRTSGRLDDFDATLLHRELLKSPGLVSGRLSGDFYLEGRVGEKFLETSLGGFNVSVRDGVLKEFPTLSKVFSLLNVSQILTFHLPDMAKDGMPFKSITGTFSLNHGILATEDLLVDSNAMNLSLVGNSDLRNGRLDYVMGVKPLRTVDKIVTKIPIAGWLLTGKEKALITAQFEIKGTDKKPKVTAIPITSVSDKVFGIFKRILKLPGHVISEAGGLIESKPKKKK